MIDSLLIANRGEIARRIIRTAKRMGIRTIAVHSDVDAGAPFTREADEAVCIGPAPARESYLNAAAILDAARRTGAAAIHPGYGFLSENADFAEAVIAAGLVWIGAPPAAIRAMGLKDAAKALMEKAGVPVTPGYLGADQSPDALAAEAKKIGFPILIKAVAGGGGKGMRRVDEIGGFEDALDSCRREAKAAFGDDRVLLERYIEAPRHIEVQIFGDTHGDVVHLFERDCSVQRRHQKVIEEAPAPGMDDATRASLCEAAVRAARAVDYIGAGTIEFIADASQGLRADRIWFMEMNTRLQVEHPVTEAITGQDLVEWQLRVASGEPLPKRQKDLAIDGCAIEARLYAENPASGFLPSPGPLTHLRFPDDIRVDSGVEEGGRVLADYDPMIAKLIVHAPTRQAAVKRLAQACACVEVWPIRTNAGFLARALNDTDFVEGRVDTGFIARRGEALIPGEEPSAIVLTLAARALLPVDDGDVWTALTGFRVGGTPLLDAPVRIAGANRLGSLGDADDGAVTGRTIRTSDGLRILFHAGEAWPIGPVEHDALGDVAASDGRIVAPMPGRVVAVDVCDGEQVTTGQRLVVLEAMKMEQALLAPFDGTVARLTATPGGQVDEGMLLLQIESASSKSVQGL